MLRQTIEYRKQELMNQIDEKLAIAEERHEKAESERLQKLKEHVWRFVYTFTHQCGLVISCRCCINWCQRMTLKNENDIDFAYFPLCWKIASYVGTDNEKAQTLNRWS